jgi:hypothetical protein
MTLLSNFVIHGNVQLPVTRTYFHPRGIDYDRSQPSGHLGLPCELVNVCVGGQKSILDRIFGVCWVAYEAQCYPSEGGQTAGENIC